MKELVRLFLDGKTNHHHETINLSTPGETVKIIVLYCCKNHNTLDLKFVVNHLAKNTHSKIRVYGLLKDYAKKSCHLEINFKKGSKNSTGSEREEVFLLSDRAKNISKPIINCAEKNVKGSHGAAIGHLDKSKLNYLISRGLPKSQAKTLLVKSILKKPLLEISDKNLRVMLKDVIK